VKQLTKESVAITKEKQQSATGKGGKKERE
jgi:hypothetical protein